MYTFSNDNCSHNSHFATLYINFKLVCNMSYKGKAHIRNSLYFSGRILEESVFCWMLASIPLGLSRLAEVASTRANPWLWPQTLRKTEIYQKLTQAESSRLGTMQMVLWSNRTENLTEFYLCFHPRIPRNNRGACTQKHTNLQARTNAHAGPHAKTRTCRRASKCKSAHRMCRLAHLHRQHASTHARKHTCTQAHMHASLRRCSHTHTYVPARLHTHTLVHVGAHTYARLFAQAHANTHVRVSVRTHRPACLHLCPRAHTGMHTQALTHAQTRLCTGTHTRTSWCACTYVYPHTRRQHTRAHLHASTRKRSRRRVFMYAHAGNTHALMRTHFSFPLPSIIITCSHAASALRFVCFCVHAPLLFRGILG